MPEQLLELAVDAAHAAGAELLRRRGHANPVEAKSTATDPVSAADRASEALLVRRIQGARPDDAIVGEEGTAQRGSSGLRWVLDPLDGTVNYLYGIPAWCVSVACEDGNGALVGVVYDPVHRETFTALRGGGAALDGTALAVNDPVPLARALVATGFGYDPAMRRAQAGVAARVLAAARDIRRGGSAALDLCAVAAGRVDGYYEDGIAHWDWAAGALVALEAGARRRMYGTGLVAAGPALLGDLDAVVRAAGPPPTALTVGA
jgi:myo-inositol-1(or 4)-monophosphatase